MNALLAKFRDLFFRAMSMLSASPDSLSSQSLRQRALLLGLPAIVVAILGVSALGYSKIVLSDSLENRYQADVDSINRDKTKLIDEINAEIRIKQAAGGGSNINEIIPKTDERRVKLEKLENSELIYWEKLISLNPDEMEYRFKFAMAVISQAFGKGEDPSRGFSLLNAIAPLTEPGYGPAHLELAQFFLRRRSNNRNEQRQLMLMAFQHSEMCLKREPKNEAAQTIKALLLDMQGRHVDAYDAYEMLFQKNPSYYAKLVQLNRKLGREQDSDRVYETALRHYEKDLLKPELSVDGWVTAWSHVISCLAGQHRFEDAESKLLSELQQQASAGVDGLVKRVVVEQLLSSIYLAWMRQASTSQTQSSVQDFEFLKKAFKHNPNSNDVLRGLTRIALADDTELAAAALEIYDPTKHRDPPALVLNELGSDALARRNYEDAIRYFEMARKKEPQNSSILNNLAYTYLVCEDRDPERSLRLVDEAIRFIPQDDSTQMVLSHFYDTRGNALMQLNRMTEAIASFEAAIKARPWHREILESLVKCYTGNNLSPEVYQQRLDELDAKEAAGVRFENGVEVKGGSAPTSTQSATNAEQQSAINK